MTEFEFSIRANLKRAWQLFAEHAWYFIFLALVMVVLTGASKWNDNGFVTALVTVASILWSYVALSSMLAAVDGKKELLAFDSLRLHFPTFRQFLKLLCVAIGAGVIIIGGFILLIIPGIYFMTRLSFANLALVDRKGGVRDSLRFSWRMVKGDVFWTVLLGLVVAIVVMIIGFALFYVGALVTYPIGMIFLTLLYRALTKYQPAQAIEVQPKEIPPAPAEPAPASEPTM